MALSGNFSTSKYTTSSHGTIGLYISWTATQSIKDNTSTIKWTVKSNGTMSSGYYVKCYKVIVKINGTKVLNTTSEFNLYGDGKYKKSGTITIAHGSDGSKTVSMSAQANIYYSGDGSAQTGSKSFTLNKINRYALFSSVTDFTDEVATNGYPTIVYTNPAGTSLTTGLKARIVWQDTSAVEHYTSWVTLNDEGGEYTFTSSTLTAQNIADMRAACPNNKALSVKFNLRSTMDGVEYDDYKTAVMNVIDAPPVFTTNPSYLDANSNVVAVTGNNQIIVRRQSKLRIFHGTAAPQKSASLMASSPYTLEFNGNPYVFTDEYVELDLPDIAGTFRATITAMDTRWISATAYVDITILDWTEPTLDCELERQNSFETKCDLSVTPHFSPLNNINSITIVEKHRQINTQTWSDDNDITDEQSPVEISLQNNYEWEMEVTITDVFVAVTYRLTVGKGIPYIYKDVYRNSLAINGIPDADNQLYVGGQVKCESMYVKDISSQYTIAKNSGAWLVVTNQAQRMGNAVHFYIEFQGNGSAVSAGTNGFVGGITGGPLPAVPVQMVSFYTSIPVLLYIDTDGTISVRPLTNGFALASTGRLRFGGVFITL